jgi:hypothetical protein
MSSLTRPVFEYADVASIIDQEEFSTEPTKSKEEPATDNEAA